MRKSERLSVKKNQHVYVFLSREVENYFVENEISVREIIYQSGLNFNLGISQNPASDAIGEKEPATIILASAAVIAAATPLLVNILEKIIGREVVIRERRLVPVEDSNRNIVHDKNGDAILHWVDIAKEKIEETEQYKVSIKGFGIEISIGGG
jgi:hypothetical protein